jgi:hypothetical protein
MGGTFSYSSLTVLPVINCTKSNNNNNIFYSSKALHTIEKWVLKDDGSQPFSNCFNLCESLENIVIEGTIGQNGLNLQWSTKLSKASITNTINVLSTTTSGLSVTLSQTAVNNAFTGGSTGSEWLNLIATKNNWTINLI